MHLIGIVLLFIDFFLKIYNKFDIPNLHNVNLIINLL